MGILFLLKKRTKFIRYFYETAAGPFRETKRKIEVGEAPFDNPPYGEDGEPPYPEEWMEAEEGLEVLGRTCLSMLSPSLKLYFETWESELGVRCGKGARKRAFKRGFLRGYQECLGEVLRLSWDGCPAGLALVEQITLARNRDQHPDDTGRYASLIGERALPNTRTRSSSARWSSTRVTVSGYKPRSG